MRRFEFWFCILALSVSGISSAAYGQSFGVELHNTLMPASGGMGGAGAEGFGEGGAKLVHETQLLYGLKARLSEQDGWRPESV